MDKNQINDVLNCSFDFSNMDDDTLDPDYILNDNSLDGILPLTNSDSEDDAPIVSIIDEGHHLETDNEYDDTNESTLKGKKREKSPLRWKRNIVIVQRAQGNETISLRNKIIKKRELTGPDCKCKLKCFSKFTDEQKLLILNIFNTIGDKEKQDTFLGGLISLNDVSRRRPRNNTKSNRSYSCVYKIRIDGINETIVCKIAFCSLFGIGKAIIERIISSIKSNNPSPKDLRGKHLNRANQISDQVIFQIRSHINSFPKCISRYSRNDNIQR